MAPNFQEVRVEIAVEVGANNDGHPDLVSPIPQWDEYVENMNCISNFELVCEQMDDEMELQALVWNFMKKEEALEACIMCARKGHFCGEHCRENFRWLYLNMYVYKKESLKEWAVDIVRSAYTKYWLNDCHWKQRWMDDLQELLMWSYNQRLTRLEHIVDVLLQERYV